ncbi:hypothetical protein ACTXT7_002874 [Hymenolepis weldensis]
MFFFEYCEVRNATMADQGNFAPYKLPCNELLKIDPEGSQLLERNTTEMEPPKMDSDDSSSAKIAQETEVVTEQFRPDNRELTEELLSITGEKKQCPPE